MSAAKRLAACLVVAAACLAALRAVRDRPSPCQDPHGSLIHPPGPEVRTIERRMAARSVVVEQVLAGELSLLQAAARFRLINDNPPEPAVSLLHFPGKSDGEKLCRQVLEWVNGRLTDRGLCTSEIEVVLCPLRCELQMLLEQNDEIDLPPAD